MKIGYNRQKSYNVSEISRFKYISPKIDTLISNPNALETNDSSLMTNVAESCET